MSDKEKKTGFESIGERIENLKDNIGESDATSAPKTSKPSQQTKTAASTPKVYSKPIKYKGSPSFRLSFAKVFWGIIAIVIIASLFSQSNNKKKANYTPSSRPSTQHSVPSSVDDDFVAVGQYRCSRYHHNRAEELKPNDYEKQSIESEKNALTSLEIEIETTYVDHSSQSSIDHYNMIVNDYNLRLELHRLNIASFNNKVDTYNNYLMSNCRKAY